jgi:hypothetical protein
MDQDADEEARRASQISLVAGDGEASLTAMQCGKPRVKIMNDQLKLEAIEGKSGMKDA